LSLAGQQCTKVLITEEGTKRICRRDAEVAGKKLWQL